MLELRYVNREDRVLAMAQMKRMAEYNEGNLKSRLDLFRELEIAPEKVSYTNEQIFEKAKALKREVIQDINKRIAVKHSLEDFHAFGSNDTSTYRRMKEFMATHDAAYGDV